MKKKFGKPPCLFKVDISYQDYERLTLLFKIKEAKEMLYLYFDTAKFPVEAKLYNAKIRLRVRVKDSGYSLELKQGIGGQYNNYAQPISLFELNSIFQGSLPNGIIREILAEQNLIAKVLLVGTTHTKRVKKIYKAGILVLDKTGSAKGCNFQIEFRSDMSFSKESLIKIQNELGVSAGTFKNKLSQVWAD